MSLDIEYSKDNYKILKINICDKVQYIGSRYCQKREVDKFIDECLSKKYNSIYIVFGLNFAEHISELLKYISEESKVLIIEINKQLIEYCKKDSKINKVLNDYRISIASDSSGVKSFYNNNINEINISDINVVDYCRYEKIYSDQLSDIYSVLRNETIRITTNRNTKLHFAKQWFKCMIKNIKYINDSDPLNSLKNMYKDIPAVIVSAGPSLEKNIDQLKGYDKGLIISGGRTLGPLLQRGINPDFLCVMDSGEISYKLVEPHLDYVKCPLVFSEYTNYNVVENHKGDKYFSASGAFLRKTFNDEVINLSAGGSVAHSMALMAVYMGCNPIIFIGQDLAYTGEKGHASCAENKWQKLTFDDYKRYDDIYVEDVNGGIVRTSVLLDRYRVALENIIEMFPNVKFINATEGGAKIKNAINEKLSYLVKCGTKAPKKDISKKKDININQIDKQIYKEKELFQKLRFNIKERKDIITRKCDYTLSNIEKLYQIDKKIDIIIDNMSIMQEIFFEIKFDAEQIEEYKIAYSDEENIKIKKYINKKSYIYDNIYMIIEKYIDRI